MIKMSESTHRRTLIGRVVSTKMNKTASVCVERKYKHPKYEKRITRSTNFLVHDPENQCCEGDKVVIQESRPISKRKAWTLLKVIEKVVGQQMMTESMQEEIQT